MIEQIAIENTRLEAQKKPTLLQRYLDFCDSQMKVQIVWYLIPLVTIATIFMPIDVFLMSYFNWYIAFVGISSLSLYANLILSIVGQHTRVTITVYMITVLFHILAPLLSFLILGV